jgi:hypothetical protein
VNRKIEINNVYLAIDKAKKYIELAELCSFGADGNRKFDLERFAQIELNKAQLMLKSLEGLF